MKKLSCNMCNFETIHPSSYKKHLETKKHNKNCYGSSVKMEVRKFKPENVIIEINPDVKIEELTKSIGIIESLSEEIAELREENMLLKLNNEEQLNNNVINEFSSIFDDDFSDLFR